MVRVEGLTKHFRVGNRTIQAVGGVTFSIPQGAFFTLLGPSGCGKTTILRCIAGLEQPDAGEVWLDERLVYSHSRGTAIPPHRRDLGVVFQSYAIWPHMTVYENAAFPLEVRRRPAGEVRRRVREVLELVGLDGLEARPAPSLSGGQQQRLALARALVHAPKVLLLDEPLSNLDAKLREQLGRELKSIQRRVGVTTCYVTHDQAEALTLSDLVGVMTEGRLIQTGPPREVYAHPHDPFVAWFVGAANLLPGRLETVNGIAMVTTACGSLRCASPNGLPSGEVLLCLRPEDIKIMTDRPVTDGLNVWSGILEDVVFSGESSEAYVRVTGTTLRARGAGTAFPPAGTTVYVVFPPERCVVVPRGAAG